MFQEPFRLCPGVRNVLLHSFSHMQRHRGIETIFAMIVDFHYNAMSVVEDDATSQ